MRIPSQDFTHDDPVVENVGVNAFHFSGMRGVGVSKCFECIWSVGWSGAPVSCPVERDFHARIIEMSAFFARVKKYAYSWHEERYKLTNSIYEYSK